MFRFHGPLYAIYPGPACMPGLVEEAVTALCEGGAGLIQYRERRLADGPGLAVARRVVQAAREHGVSVLINDRVDLVWLANAAGVHLGQDDLPIAEARHLLGEGSIVGISVDTAEEARTAEADGADYVSLGPAYPTSSKADVPPPRPLALYEQLTSELSIPVVAIGGISAANVGPLAVAGVDAVAVISALYAGPDVRSQAEAIGESFLSARRLEGLAGEIP
jgi:thiamine-phosphate diphosphorylase